MKTLRNIYLTFWLAAFALIYTALMCPVLAQVSNPGVQRNGSVTVNDFAAWATSNSIKSVSPATALLLACNTAGSLFSVDSAGTFSCFTPPNSTFIFKNSSNSITSTSAASQSVIRIGTSVSNPIVPSSMWGAAAFVSLTYATTIAVDMSTFLNASVTLTGSATLGSPTNAKPGQSGVIAITQDATGGRVLAYGSVWKFSGGIAPALTATANATDYLTFFCQSSTFCYATIIPDIK